MQFYSLELQFHTHTNLIANLAYCYNRNEEVAILSAPVSLPMCATTGRGLCGQKVTQSTILASMMCSRHGASTNTQSGGLQLSKRSNDNLCVLLRVHGTYGRAVHMDPCAFNAHFVQTAGHARQHGLGPISGETPQAHSPYSCGCSWPA